MYVYFLYEVKNQQFLFTVKSRKFEIRIIETLAKLNSKQIWDTLDSKHRTYYYSHDLFS